MAALPPVQFVGGRATSENVPRQSLGNNCVMRLTPNAVCQQDETILTLVGTDASGEYKTKTFTVLVNDRTSDSCIEPEVGVLRIDDGPVHNFVGASIRVPVLIKIPQNDSNTYDPITNFGFDIVYSAKDLYYIDYETANASISFENNGIFTVDASINGIIQIQASTTGQGYLPNKAGEYLVYLKFQVNM